MKFLLVVLLVVYASAAEDIIDIPDCYIVKLETHAECFTFSNNVYAPHSTANDNCAVKNGQLAVITNEGAWEILLEKFLKGAPNHVWTGYHVHSSSVQLLPVQDLTNMSKYWSDSSINTGHYGQCIYAAHNVWTWHPTGCGSAYDYFCQYNVTNCRISEIEFPHINIKSCYTTDVVSNGTTVEIECFPGYYLNTSNHVTCINGIWETPQCVAGCPPPGKREHADLTLVTSYYNVGEKIHYICKDDYFSWKNHDMTHFTLTCLQDSTWSDEDSHCSVEHKFSTVVVNVSEVRDDTINLDCDLRSNNKSWTHNGRNVRNSSAFVIAQTGTLMIKSDAAKIDGIYLCTGVVSGQLRIGRNAYQLVGRNECRVLAEAIRDNEITRLEGENVMLYCPQEHEDHHVTWFKDDQEIRSNEHRNIIPAVGLFISYVELLDEGHYKCQTTFKVKTNNCIFNVSQSLFVTASVKSVCGTIREVTEQHYQPWLAILRQEDEIIPFCYGTLLNEKWVVTSAFCLARLRLKKKIVGVYLELGPEGRQLKIPIRIIKVHPTYRSRRNANDIGLIRLHDAPIKFTNEILPACITPIDIGNVHKCEHISDLNGTVSGWGPLFDDIDEKILDTEEMSLIPKEICRKTDTLGYAEDKFCAKFNGDDEESYAGDSGSPFLVNYKGRQHLLGIYTWGDRETRAGDYDFFTSVSHHYKWIKEIID